MQVNFGLLNSYDLVVVGECVDQHREDLTDADAYVAVADNRVGAKVSQHQLIQMLNGGVSQESPECQVSNVLALQGGAGDQMSCLSRLGVLDRQPGAILCARRRWNPVNVLGWEIRRQVQCLFDN